MTGRKGRQVSVSNSMVKYESRHEANVPLAAVNMKEKEVSCVNYVLYAYFLVKNSYIF